MAGLSSPSDIAENGDGTELVLGAPKEVERVPEGAFGQQWGVSF
jgi:hypothetical protein